jgi:nucleotide-binding universal stress UspA family protein
VFTTIVAGTDGSETARKALGGAVDLAKQSAARLIIVSAYEPVDAGRSRAEEVGAPADVQWSVGPRPDVLELLEASRRLAADAGLDASVIETVARQGDAADAIIDVAEEQGADLIVVGNKGMTGAKRFLLGSVPNRVSHHAPCSVLIVRTT